MNELHMRDNKKAVSEILSNPSIIVRHSSNIQAIFKNLKICGAILTAGRADTRQTIVRTCAYYGNSSSRKSPRRGGLQPIPLGTISHYERRGRTPSQRASRDTQNSPAAAAIWCKH